MVHLLSHILSEDDPPFPNAPTMRIKPFARIENGDVCNTSVIEIFNHFGTHMDAPKHFFDKGLSIAELPVDFFIFNKPLILDIPLDVEQLLTKEMIAPFESEIKKCDLLCIRSGFALKRSSDPNVYSSRGPGLSASLCKYFMDEFRNIKCIGIDWISVTSYPHLEDGILAHRYLMGSFHDRYITVIEELNLEKVYKRGIGKVIALPLFVKGSDSAPVTVIAFEDGTEETE